MIRNKIDNSWLYDLSFNFQNRSLMLGFSYSPDFLSIDIKLNFENVEEYKIIYAEDYEKDYVPLVLGLLTLDDNVFELTTDVFEIKFKANLVEESTDRN